MREEHVVMAFVYSLPSLGAMGLEDHSSMGSVLITEGYISINSFDGEISICTVSWQSSSFFVVV